MYGLRRRWVPVFFKDIPMFGLMRTTSLSEGQNWSFQNNTLTGSYLLMFMMIFEGVMERQRRNQFVNNFNTATTLPRFITSSSIEPHASKVTHSTIDGSYKYRCVSFLSHDASKLKSYLEELNKLKKKIVDDCPAPEMPSRESFYNQIIGVQLTNDVPDIENPSDIRNKGTGSRGKRLKSTKEMLEKVSSKPKQKCALCKQMAYHDK
uniref:Protein FAR1-RELATED SEQUENCE n=1 Tax=Lactuca sativa TaxID=4236 RepID=A0A9R1X3X2_LACSA|nr:hypothetical protein LSAT_V11C600333640 [Lactuca sativa]